MNWLWFAGGIVVGIGLLVALMVIRELQSDYQDNPAWRNRDEIPVFITWADDAPLIVFPPNVTEEEVKMVQQWLSAVRIQAIEHANKI